MFPNFIGGSDQALEVFIGEELALDPNKYFIILPGQFGNGFSSSPSNTPAPYDRSAFPPVNVADDVIAQQRLVCEHFRIEQLQLVLGWSIGALQAYEWAIRFPEMVRRVAPVAGAPKPSAWTQLWLSTVIEEMLTADPAWNDGFYTDTHALQAGARRQGHATALTVAPAEFFHEGGPASLGFASADDLVRGFFEAFWLNQDANNVISQARKAARADPSGGVDVG
jgi:homoserine O-acetyltransferase/O-succinyltransferase